MNIGHLYRFSKSIFSFFELSKEKKEFQNYWKILKQLNAQVTSGLKSPNFRFRIYWFITVARDYIIGKIEYFFLLDTQISSFLLLRQEK